MDLEKNTLIYNLIVVGGGAAGFFAAINYAKNYPSSKVLILEKSSTPLGKVKISGGGRCNVTHHCFNAVQLSKNYPRGGKKLVENFKKFGPEQTIQWFKQRGVEIKVEPDGRMFPTSNSSQTIIDCFFQQANKHNVKLLCNQNVGNFYQENSTWFVETSTAKYSTEKLLIATGSSNLVWQKIAALGYQIAPAVPSLFTFNIKNTALQSLMGVSVEPTHAQILGSNFSSTGPLLFTHWGVSGPAVLKLSAFAAEYLASVNYRFSLKVNWLPEVKVSQVEAALKTALSNFPDKLWENVKIFDLPTRLWEHLVQQSSLKGIKLKATQAKNLSRIVNYLTASVYEVDGKSTFKEEFVTCGGVELTEINLKTMESNKHANLYFCGEVLNIDAVTGGFNFQAAWTNAYLFAENAH